MTMTAEQAVERLGGLADAAALRAQSLADACRRARDQWDGLGRFGGRRGDHAASLLAAPLADVVALRKWVEAVEAQLRAAQANPWGE